MQRTKIAAAALIVLLLSACQTMGAKGVSATDCFAAGGVIDSSGETSMCTMKDGTSKPIV